MFKYFFLGILLVVLNSSCKSTNHKTEEASSSQSFISDTLKSSLNKLAKSKFNNAKSFAIRVTKLHKNTILNIEPIYYNDYLKEYGNPADVYLYASSLFLIYYGIEAITNFSSKQDITVTKFKDFCLQQGIGTRENKVYDNPLFFLKVEGNTLILYSKGTERDFYNCYFELEETKPIFTPDK